MVKVRFLQHFMPYIVGDIAGLEEDIAKKLIEAGIAEKLTEPKEQEQKEKAVETPPVDKQIKSSKKK